MALHREGAVLALMGSVGELVAGPGFDAFCQ